MATKRQASKSTPTTKRARKLDAIKRVSRLNGREGDAFHSDEMQETAVHGWAKLNGTRIARVFDETDSVSGGTTDREGLQLAMARALDGTTDGIIVSAVDRFARNMIEGIAAIKQLTEAGASFVAVEQGIDTGATNKQTRATSMLLLGFMFLLAEWQRETLGEKWEGIRERQIARGVAGNVPFGFIKDEHRRLQPHPTDAPVVVEMFERRARGESPTAIARDLNARNVLTTTGGQWTSGRVSDLVQRRVYLGELTSGHDIINPDAHAPLVDVALFDRANAKGGRRGIENRGTKSDRALLCGLLRCASCGQTMGIKHPPHSRRGSEASRYTCRVHGGFGRCPSPASVIVDDIEAHVTEALHAEALSKLNAEGVATTDALDAATAELERAQSALTSWATDTALDVLRAEAPDDYDAGTRVRTAARDAAREAVQREREALGVRADLPNNLGEIWPTLTVEEQREWLHAWFTVIAVRPAAYRREPAAKRVDLYTVNDTDTPTGFTVTAVAADGRRRPRAVLCPITMR